MPLDFNKAKFKSSYKTVYQIKSSSIPQFAFIGRSNVGKSSLINALCQRKDLAKTSSVPGKTQLINFFDIEDKIHLVDLPGYGYAKVSKKLREEFEGLISEYLVRSEDLFIVFVLIDAAIPPQQIDLDFVNWCGTHKVPIGLIFTKTDKKKPKITNKNIHDFLDSLSRTWDDLPVSFETSSTKIKGIDDLKMYIDSSLKLV